jgi:molecular chaperone DnaJ
MDLYILLGVEREASPAEIKRAYRRLARRLHPDINPGDREAAVRFRQIMDAYETLMDPDRRRRYDAGGLGCAEEGGGAFGFTGFDFTRSGAEHTTFGDLFEDVLTRRADRDRHGAPERGADLHVQASLSFEDAWRGVRWPVAVTRHVPCLACAGSGTLQTVESSCFACEGSGTVRSVRGHMVFSKNCPQCGGTGRLRQRLCETCRGQAVQTHAESLEVSIPPGVADGSLVRVAGKGHAGVRGGSPGDLYVRAAVRPHPLFRRVDDDVYLTVPVAIHEAALGARVAVPTPDGPARLRIPPGTQSGQRFRLRDRGVPSLRTGTPGDLIVEIRLMLPRLLDERSKELLREFGRINGESVREGFGATEDDEEPPKRAARE